MYSDINSTTTQMLLLLFCWILTAESGVKYRTCGAVEPVDPYFFIGEKLDLSCTIYNISSNQTVQLYFVTSENKMGKWKDKKMNPSLQLNNTAIRLIIPGLTITDAMNHYISRSYRCMVQKMVNECTSKNKKAIDNQRVRIDYFPQKPENFSCHVYNWEKMTCTWNMITYFHKKDIRITYFWKANQTCEGNLLNYTVHESATSFTIPNFEMQPNYCFYFEINNVVRNVRITTDVYHISPPEIVKPAPVGTISFQIINETCVTVAWDKSKQFGEENQCVYRVRLMSECSTEQQFHLLERIATVCGLNPFTNYTLIVNSMPRNMKGSSPLESVGFFSDPQTVKVPTSASVPAYNPKLLSFRDVSPSKTPYRYVLLYWEPLSSCDLHDSPSSQQYEIITKQRGSEEMWNFIVNNSEATSHSLTLPDKEKIYEVKLRVITGSGKKREDFSHLVIWPKSQSPVAPSMVLEYATMKTGTEFYVTLNLTEAQSQTTQVLYWCKVSQESGCLKQMSHIEINGNSTKLSIKDYKMDIMFGVESRQWHLKEIARSGIQIVNCIYPKDQRPLIPPKHFHIAKGMAERGELSLEWDPYDCNGPELESGYVLSYNLYYCQVTDESCNMNNNIAYSLHKISVEGYIYSYTIRNLQPGSRYKVWLTARTSAGEGPSTDVICQDIFFQEFPLWGKIVTLVGFVILILAITYYIIKSYQYVRDRKNAFGMIEVPDTRFQILNTDSYVQIQTSNGHVPQMNGHVMVDNQSAATIPDMSESEELNRLLPITPTLDAKIEMAKSSSLAGILLDLWKSDQIQQETSFSSIDKGCYVSIRNRNSASIDIASDRDIYDDKEINGDVLVLNSGYGYQNANLLPEDYSRAVSNEDCVTNSESCSALYEDSLDYTFFKLQGQAVHSHLIDGPDLQGLLLDECKGNNCEREKNVYSVCVTENSPQEHVITEKQTETVHMKSNELSLSGDDLDDGTADDSLSLLDEIISFDKTEEKSGYVCANEVQNEVEESIHSFNPRKYNEYSNIRKNILGSNDEHIKHESDNTRSDCDHMRSENDHLRSDANELIHKFNIDYINCSIGDAVIHPYMNIVQSGIPVDELVGQKEN